MTRYYFSGWLQRQIHAPGAASCLRSLAKARTSSSIRPFGSAAHSTLPPQLGWLWHCRPRLPPPAWSRILPRFALCGGADSRCPILS